MEQFTVVEYEARNAEPVLVRPVKARRRVSMPVVGLVSALVGAFLFGAILGGMGQMEKAANLEGQIAVLESHQ